MNLGVCDRPWKGESESDASDDSKSLERSVSGRSRKRRLGEARMEGGPLWGSGSSRMRGGSWLQG